MKEYKIAVPESGWYDEVLIDRQEIHELIKAHAEKLGWNKNGDILGVDWFYFESDSSWCLSARFHPDVHKDYQEISPFDFLKLTPEDVNDTDVVEIQTTDHNKQALLEAFTAGWDAAHNNRFSIGVNFDKWYHEKAETIKNLRGKYKNYLNPTTNDRNEKAWFTVQINGEWFKNSIDVYCEKDIELAKEMLKIVSDNFIKQVGNK